MLTYVTFNFFSPFFISKSMRLLGTTPCLFRLWNIAPVICLRRFTFYTCSNSYKINTRQSYQSGEMQIFEKLRDICLPCEIIFYFVYSLEFFFYLMRKVIMNREELEFFNDAEHSRLIIVMRLFHLAKVIIKVFFLLGDIGDYRFVMDDVGL